MRFANRLKACVFFLALAVAASYAAFNSDWFQRQFVYPFPSQDIVYRHARQNNLDPFLVAAVIHAESKFLPAARSPKGAVGLMQVMPETGQWVASQLDIADFAPARLTDPETNIRIGSWYLASLKKEFRGNELLALAAYNGGRGNVRQWINQYGWNYDFQEIEQIPFRETREYVKRVAWARERYRDLYGR